VTDGHADAGRPVLIAFDGSRASRQAVVAMAGLFSDRRCVILTVSTPDNLDVGEFESDRAVTEEHRLDSADLDRARRLSEEGAALAADAGMRAEPSSLRAPGPAWAAIIDVARTLNAGLIAVGARNRHPLVDGLLGSQALRVLQHADVPVAVVHAPRNVAPTGGSDPLPGPGGSG
jgi:nucleotide-binding universal stress UspA family protein